MSGSKAGAAKAHGGKGRDGAGAAPLPADRADRAVREAAAPPAPGGAEESAPREGEYVVQLPTFEGPLDLLLHLIQKHELDILDIPVSFITEKYLEYLKLMRSLSIDLASEYLVMAATLAHIKSKMLLPSVPAGQDDDGMPGEEEEDPRAELVRRLLEYQKYKAAAAELSERGTLGRDVFLRGMSEAEVPKGPAPFAPISIFGLLDAFERVLKRTNVQIDHEVVFDRISITDRIVELTEKLTARRAMRFEDLLLDSVSKGGVIPRFEVVITFLAVLEMCKMRLIRVHQTDPLAPIHIELAVADGAPPAAPGSGDGTGAPGDGAKAEGAQPAEAQPSEAQPAEAQPSEAQPEEARGAPPAEEHEPAEVGDGGSVGAEAAEAEPVEAGAVEAEPSAEAVPPVEEEPSVEAEPSAEAGPPVEAVPPVEEEPSVEAEPVEADAVEAGAVEAEQPVEAESPVEEEPSAEAGPLVEEEPSVEAEPSAEAGPLVEEEPSVEAEPLAEAEPSAEAEPPAEAGPPVEEEPSVEAEPVEAGAVEAERPVEAEPPIEAERVESESAEEGPAEAEPVEVEPVEPAEEASGAPAETGGETAAEESTASVALEQPSTARGEAAMGGERAAETEPDTALEDASRDVATGVSDGAPPDAAETPAADVDEVDAGSGRDGG